MNTPITDSLSNEIGQLTPEQQGQVYEFVKQLRRDQAREQRRAALAELAGSIPHGDIELMKAAIEEGCEQINPNAW